MEGCSCSHWWHAPFYLAMSATLAFIAITSTGRSTPDDTHPGFALAFNASRALRLHGGYHIFATLLHISPELFLSSPESTVFAIQDSAISHLSIPPWDMRRLLRSHAAPTSLPMSKLFKKPPGYCFRTLVDGKNLVITNKNVNAGSVTINNVPITHPDVFLEGPLSVHGVLVPFEPLSEPYCNASGKTNLVVSGRGNQTVDWTRIIRLLSSNGFVSFAIGLNTVVDRILQDYKNISAVTVFAPPDSSAMASVPAPILYRFVRLHIVPHRFTSLELSAVDNTSLKTLIPGLELKIGKFSKTLVVSGVEITAPDIRSSKEFVIHGISRDFDLEQFFSTFW
ncbi:fasciclin-like arabinogalactan protein 21 [Andrographis paniculata]|uniref:fasciclin-like arabinogalactan protein 21 n=1 Tax=Andrographis paniculata TaxID=175694 RepID=UPI0021E7C9BD|nr:fasciclin-like arabinogalactan protein 21 [Andrographis paniculata]